VEPDKDPHSPTLLYNGMINPLIPYAFRGVIWYQGESNKDHPEIYTRLFGTMIKDWRAQWDQGAFPFLYVQVAPYYQMPPEIREAQADTLATTENTAMVVTTDCGDAKDIHPARKEPVGARLALAARAKAYGQGVEYSGPVFESARFGGGVATVSFSHVGMGLSSGGDPLKGFTLAGKDGVFRPADAVIRGREVIVSSPEVSEPVAVRYGWENVPDCNLSNLAGLPASPFRSDRPQGTRVP
jgi:sialate O-acetylesterase